jgi:serine O-acetyltransferase
MARHLEVLAGGSTVWSALREEGAAVARAEPGLASLIHSVILSHGEPSQALSFQLSRKLGDSEISPMTVREICTETYASEPQIVAAAEADLVAVAERDPAAKGHVEPFLFYKGFLALQVHRLSHRLYRQGRETLARHFQSRTSELFQVDIHPAARIGKGVFIDHATGVVIGETAVVGDDVSMLHGVTLGGTGAQRGDRHPKIGRGVLLGAGAKVLGNIEIGDYAKIASGSVVLKPVPAHCTAAGVPARLVNCPTCEEPARSMDHTVPDLIDWVI